MTAGDLAAALRRQPRQTIALPGFAAAAVLVLIVVERSAQAGESDQIALTDARLTFIVRDADLRTHAGQVAFPGGRAEPRDGDLVHTALRETEEELGIARDRVAVLGLLDDVPTPSGYIITPVTGVATAPLEARVQAAEVAEVFEVPLALLAAPGSYRADGMRHFEGIDYVMHEYHVAGHRIWGATARVVHQLLSIVAAADGAPRR